MTEIARCQICGEPMPPGEEMFKHHGYSGDCPKPPLHPTVAERDPLRAEHQRLTDAVVASAKWFASEPVQMSITEGESNLYKALSALAAFEAQHPEVRG